MALFSNPEMIKCMMILPRDQALLETDSPHGSIPRHLDFGDSVTKQKAAGIIWPLTLWAAMILDTTPEQLQNQHRQTFKKIYGNDFEEREGDDDNALLAESVRWEYMWRG